MREKLHDDGAAWACCFTTLIDGVWDCPKDAVAFIGKEAYGKLKLPKKVFLHGRALCETHLQFFGE